MVRTLVKKTTTRTLILSAIIIGVLIYVYPDPKAYVLGYVFGMLVSILTFLLLKNTVQRAVKMEPSRAEGFATRQYYIRMLIYFVTIAIGAVADYLDLLSTIVGLLSIKLAIYLSALFDKDFK